MSLLLCGVPIGPEPEELRHGRLSPDNEAVAEGLTAVTPPPGAAPFRRGSARHLVNA